MTPGARVAAAMGILDDVQGGMPAERALTTWARNSRFTGSKDRAAIVFLRVNRRRGDVPAAIAILAEDGIDALPHDQVNTAVFVTSNHRRVKNARLIWMGLSNCRMLHRSRRWRICRCRLMRGCLIIVPVTPVVIFSDSDRNLETTHAGLTPTGNPMISLQISGFISRSQHSFGRKRVDVKYRSLSGQCGPRKETFAIMQKRAVREFTHCGTKPTLAIYQTMAPC